MACTEWLKVFRWVDGQEDWEQPRHVKHGLDALSRMQLTRANEIMNRCPTENDQSSSQAPYKEC